METFLWPVRVYYEDTDSGGVVYYANYLRFMERARTEWLRSRGFEQDELISNDGVIFAVRSAKIDYLSPGRFNDLLHVSARVIAHGRASLTFEQHVLKNEEKMEGKQLTLCSGEVKIACLDVKTMRPKAIPARLLSEITP